MTIQLRTTAASKSKAVLAAALNASPINVAFLNPTPRGDYWTTGADWPKGHSDVVVLDPATRHRFASVRRDAAGVFTVK